MEKLRASQSMVNYFKKEQEAILENGDSVHREEPKQETLEEVVNKLSIKEAKDLDLFLKGIKWQQEQDKKLYSEEEVDVLVDMLQKCKEYFLLKTDSKSEERADAIGEVLKQFKKK